MREVIILILVGLAAWALWQNEGLRDSIADAETRILAAQEALGRAESRATEAERALETAAAPIQSGTSAVDSEFDKPRVDPRIKEYVRQLRESYALVCTENRELKARLQLADQQLQIQSSPPQETTLTRTPPRQFSSSSRRSGETIIVDRYGNRRRVGE